MATCVCEVILFILFIGQMALIHGYEKWEKRVDMSDYSVLLIISVGKSGQVL